MRGANLATPTFTFLGSKTPLRSDVAIAVNNDKMKDHGCPVTQFTYDEQIEHTTRKDSSTSSNSLVATVQNPSETIDEMSGLDCKPAVLLLIAASISSGHLSSQLVKFSASVSGGELSASPVNSRTAKTTTAVKIPRITMTMSNSVRVKPRSSFLRCILRFQSLTLWVPV